MTFSGDPYRTLGLAPGATLDDVKRAYRRLAKQYHPDAAGPGATDRFLAIQGAYEALVGPGRRRSPGRSPTRPSQADPDRARATREAWRASRGAGWGSGTGTPGAAGAPKARGTSGADDPWRGGTRRPSGAGPAGRTAGPGEDPRRAAGAASGPGPTGPRPSGRATGSADGDRRGGRRKATLNSTSYDDAAREPRHPEWQGSSWYGTSSGTYWTINPREYADPRKHGPEYQARARRAAADAGPGQPEPDRRDPAATPASPASASFAAGGAEGAWSDAGALRHGAPGRGDPRSAGTRPGTAGAPTAEPSRASATSSARSEDGPSGVPTAGSIGLLAGALAAIPAGVVALASIMSGDLTLAAGAVVAPFGVALVAGLAAGINRGGMR